MIYYDILCIFNVVYLTLPRVFRVNKGPRRRTCQRPSAEALGQGNFPPPRGRAWGVEDRVLDIRTKCGPRLIWLFRTTIARIYIYIYIYIGLW